MALELKIVVSGYDNPSHTLTIDDTTGAYSSPTNIGGYGSPNPERNTLALVVSSTRVNTNQELVKWSDPLTDTSFDFDYLGDGVSDIYLCALPFEAGAFDPTLMTLGYVFYSVVDDKVYKVVFDTDGVTQIVEETNDVVGNSLYTSEVLKYLVKSYAEEKRITLWCEYIQACSKKLPEEYVDLLKTIEASECYFEDAYYTEADNAIAFTVQIDKLR